MRFTANEVTWYKFPPLSIFLLGTSCLGRPSLRGRRLKGKGRGDLGARETRGARVVFNIHQANVKILIGPSSKHVNHSLNTLIRLAEINITLLSNLIDLSVII